MSEYSPVARILVADDDPVSLRFLCTALGELGCETVAAENGERALDAARDVIFDLLLLDCRMPDLGGADLLTALRTRAVATPALATSAHVDAALRGTLLRMGFVDVVVKPPSMARLAAVLQSHIAGFSTSQATPGPITTLLDDAGAYAAAGDGNLGALRALFAQELAELEAQWRCIDPAEATHAMRERLHRLRASCRFCGATALAGASRELDAALRAAPSRAQPALREFLRMCRATAQALDDQSGASTRN